MKGVAVLLALLAVVPAAMAQNSQQPSCRANMNVDQEVVAPGGSVLVSLSCYGGPAEGTVEMRRIDPVGVPDWQTAPGGGLVETLPFSLSPEGPGSSYQPYVETLNFSSLPAGLMVMELHQGGETLSTQTLQVTDMGLVVRSVGPDRLVWALTLENGTPVAGARVLVAGASVAVTGPDGVAVVGATGSIVAEKGSRAAALPSNPGGFFSPSGSGVPAERRVLSYTDRPTYRPGQLVHMKVVAWQRSGRSFLPGGGVVNVTIAHDENGRRETVWAQPLRVNAYGTAVADVSLPPDAAPGTYSIESAWGTTQGYGTFQVQEYRLPSFQVTVTAPDALVAGDPLGFQVAATRFNGEPLDQGKVHYDLSSNGCYDCNQPSATPPADTTLDQDGLADVTFPHAGAGPWTLSATVTAATGEAITASASVEVAASAVRVAIGAAGPIAPGVPTDIPITVTDLAGAPVATSVDATLTDMSWNGTGGWHQANRLVWSAVLQSPSGTADAHFTVAAGTEFLLKAVARDAAGRESSDERSLWTGAPGEAERVTVNVASKAVTPGTPLAGVISAPSRAPILVTAEGGAILGHQVLQGPGPFTLMGATSGGPQVTLVATQMEPGTGFLPYTQTDQADVVVAPHPRALNVSVTPDQATYRNGATARLLVTVRDAQGPVQAEVSLAMVDEALLALGHRSTDSILSTFYPVEGAGSETDSWQRRYLYMDGMAFGAGGALPQAMATTTMPPETMSVQAAPPAPPSGVAVRSFFPETALWLGQAETDANGTLRIAAQLPDTLTGWDVAVQAVTRSGEAGAADATLATRRDVEADLYAPRFMVVGDHSTVQATVANHLNTTRDIQLLFQVSGAVLLGDSTRTLTLAPGASGVASFPVSATASGLANFTLYAWAGGEPPAGDAITRTIPVHPHGTPSHSSQAGHGSATVTVAIPAAAAEGKGTIAVTVSPSLGNALVDALPYLTGYPYGCVEQTLTRFLPDVAVSQAARRLGFPNVDPNLDDEVQKGLDKLYGYQHPTGAWGWWTTDADNGYTTAYVIYGLAKARDAGYVVDADVWDRGVRALEAMANASAESPSLHAYQEYALAMADPHLVTALAPGPAPGLKAMNTVIAKLTGIGDPKALEAGLVATGIREGDTLHWSEPQESWTTHGITSDTMATALALRAIVAVDPNSPDADAVMRWLLEARSGNQWGTTKDTAETLFAITETLLARGDAATGAGATVTVDQATQVVRFTASDAWRATPPIVFDVGPGDHKLTITSLGGALYWSAFASWTDGTYPIRADAAAFRFTRELDGPDGPTDHMTVGDTDTVRVTVTALEKERAYVQVEDPLPAGVEAVAPDAPTWWYDGGQCCTWSNAELHDNRVDFFADSMRVGESATFSYQVHAILAGTYAVLPTTANGMYDPQAAGHGDESVLTVASDPTLNLGRVAIRHTENGTVAVVNVRADPAQGAVQVAVESGSGSTPVVPAVAGDADPGVVHLSIPVPDGPFRLHLTQGASQATFQYDPRPAPALAVRGFSAAESALWGAGPVLQVTSPLHTATAAPNYARLFAAIPLEGLGGIPSTPRTPGVSVGLVALALLALAFRRR
ncbi:MAG: alpha-2-macroglobulin family protein [Thermoplasmatota archaeon]